MEILFLSKALRTYKICLSLQIKKLIDLKLLDHNNAKDRLQFKMRN